MKLVIIDDNDDFRENITFFITQKLGFDVIGSFSSGIDFIQNFSTFNPDVILMDISMPELDGYEVTKMLNWQDSNLNIIAVTMFTDKAYLHKLIEVGFKGCVFKSRIYTELSEALKMVSEGYYYWPESMGAI